MRCVRTTRSEVEALLWVPRVIELDPALLSDVCDVEMNTGLEHFVQERVFPILSDGVREMTTT